ncbi:MAG: energy transducer TonB [Wenzhouxiangellaceae bacterium]|nr:energy transducer TonB [Wenzhouxiangellaceae bacterium]
MRPLRQPRTETETMMLALVVAVILHVAFITQMHFDWNQPAADSRAPNLDVILVDWASERAPDKADFLAQANQVGGGENPDLERPSAPPPSQQASPTPPLPEPEPKPTPEPESSQSLDQWVTAAVPDATLTRHDESQPEPAPLPDASELLRQTRQIVQSAPDPLAFERVVPKRPRRKFVTANTREHLYASYMRAWVAKVERVGNMNYPEMARRQNLEGSLVMTVDVLPDGSIERVQVLRSSGYDLLDEAAVRIVRLAAPYAELPPDIRAETDILTITRTWQFSANRGLN